MMARHENGALPTTILNALANGSCRTMDDLVDDLGLTRRQVSDGAAKLAYRKYLCRMERGCYQLTDAGLAAAAAGEVITSGPLGPDTKAVRSKVSNTFRDRAWRAMRVRRQFTMDDIVADAATDDDADPKNNVARFIRFLRLSGYVAEQRSRQPGTRLTSAGLKRFSLIRDTGPLAPVFRPKTGMVHDYNIGEDVPCREK